MSRIRPLVWIAPALIVMSGVAHAQKARAYYDELYKAGGLDRVSAQYACFDEDQSSENFFIFSTSDALKASFVEHKQYESLDAKAKAMFNKGFLNLRPYHKGLPLSDNDDQYMKDGSSWLSEPFVLDKITTGKLRLRISFETLRYRRSVEVTRAHSTRQGTANFGRCELISPDVQQNAH